ncbi:hypothetical protein B0H14DRAFT_2631455 [Mycena olivaceomarginata]|nr:hypothetical protein B0H14DRAFT_2631455 [Mycena olivaceomarginata]
MFSRPGQTAWNQAPSITVLYIPLPTTYSAFGMVFKQEKCMILCVPPNERSASILLAVLQEVKEAGKDVLNLLSVPLGKFVEYVCLFLAHVQNKAGKDFQSYDVSWFPEMDPEKVAYEMRVELGLGMYIRHNKPGMPEISSILRNRHMGE